MWCWHRIRETESGLCPACRTPYGDDPHEFSAVDMEEVVKANKEKAAAEKRERERLRQQQALASYSGLSSGLGFGSGSGGPSAGSGALSNLGHMHIGGGSDGDLAVAMSSGSIGRGHSEPPKDRNQLANMRVIRRNLVYAVGLPPSVATEEQLRKPEYFGQYGKILKIVINRNHNGNGDPRRASASAYVTFAHKEDTLACILALDGFYLDGRNVRASYGTSKYCSAFIKNVRCNNPDCTYLHCMGDAEDTFTKQEIQAGYVTSGRDVLARQQQQNASIPGGAPKRRSGGGGPSGTGKFSSNPVFPVPTYDESPKPAGLGSASANNTSNAGGNLCTRPMPVSISGFSTVAAGVPSAASIAAGKMSRSASLGTSQPSGVGSLTPAHSVVTGLPSVAATKVGAKTSKVFGLPGASTQPTNSGLVPATAASVVAGLASANTIASSVQPPAHTTLTPLGSLKRGTSMPVSVKNSSLSALGGIKPSVASSSGGVISLGGNEASSDMAGNLPVLKGLNITEQAALLDQKKDVSTNSARLQRDTTTKSPSFKSGVHSAGGGSQHQSGTSSSASTPSLSSVSGPPVPAMKQGSPGKESTASPGVIGGTVIGSIGSSGSNVGVGAVGTVVGQGISGLGSLGAVGCDASVKSGLLISGTNCSAPNFGSIGSASSNGGSSLLGGHPISGGRAVGAVKDGLCGNIGGSVLAPQSLACGTFAGVSNDKWGKVPDSSDNGLFGNSGSFGIGGAGIWANEGSGRPTGIASSGDPGTVGSAVAPVNAIGSSTRGGEIGSGRVIGQVPSSAVGGAVGGSSLFGNSSLIGPSGRNSGSSALASMLGIELPTGSGSLREASTLWNSSPNQPLVGGLSNPGIPPTPIGSGMKPGGGLVIGQRSGTSGGGVPIGVFGSTNTGTATIGGSNNNDIALLQSLLPGVRITSGNAHRPAASIASGTGGIIGGSRLGSVSSLQHAPHHQQHQQRMAVGGISIQQQQNQGNRDTWGGSGLYQAASGEPSPASTQPQQQQQQQQHRQASIW